MLPLHHHLKNYDTEHEAFGLVQDQPYVSNLRYAVQQCWSTSGDTHTQRITLPRIDTVCCLYRQDPTALASVGVDLVATAIYNMTWLPL